ncbi:uncharacterized protein LOC122498380 [Leptopilina heterotoma]|uniref:uncharacterized protein LOC122498380 n=1 Tax=Leptopilina heterotoma TaxID=63436 RepID=UPI001CA9BE60|nr:uncharacterized protein LOC122498380 [Leptopilina heterotoma]
MNTLLLLKLLSILVVSSIAKQRIQWNSYVTTRIVKPLIREFSDPWTKNLIQNQFYHYKTHFGIIIKEGSKISLSVEAASTIENLFFYCLADAPDGSFNILDLAGKSNFSKSYTAYYDCVPMMSVSNNVPVTIRIKTREWLPLPMFDSNDVTLHSSEKDESEFYQKVQVYGFVENYYTQMLLSVRDIENLKSSSSSLYVGLLNQIEVVEYYDYLTTIHTYEKKDILSSLKFIDRTSLFIRSERCNEYNVLNSATCSNFNFHWISVTDNIEAFLQPERGSSWILLQQFAHYYNRKETDVSFGETYNLWNDMFAIMYQQRFRKQNNRVNTDLPYKLNDIFSYQYGKLFPQWNYEEKLSLFISLFGYDGTDTNLREFRIRHMPNNQVVTSYFPSNIVPTILEIFFDLYDINLLPFLKKVINFDEHSLLNYDFELLLATGKNVMPAVDSRIKPTDLSIRSEERDLREISPLMLMTEMEINYVKVAFKIISPIDLTNCCLYLNNKCHTIYFWMMHLELPAGVYSVYIAEKKGENVYASDITYHSIKNYSYIKVDVRNIPEDIASPLIHYSFDVLDVNDNVFINIFIKYSDMTLRIKELHNEISGNSTNDDEYFSINLKRNDSSIMKYSCSHYSLYQTFSPVLQVIKINDEITIYHQDADRLKLNLEWEDQVAENSYTFLVTNVGLNPIIPESKVKSESDVKKAVNYFNRPTTALQYAFDALGFGDELFLIILIDYIDSTITMKQIKHNIHGVFWNELYFSISLERDGDVIFKHEFSGDTEKNKSLLNKVHKFSPGDKINCYHREPRRLKFNLPEYNSVEEKNSFVLTTDGLYSLSKNSVYDMKENKIAYKGITENNKSLIDEVHKFFSGDTIYFYHSEPSRLKLNLPGYHSLGNSNYFLLKNDGLYNIQNETSNILGEKAHTPELQYTFDALGYGDPQIYT